jgi:hypothetical protein
MSVNMARMSSCKFEQRYRLICMARLVHGEPGFLEKISGLRAKQKFILNDQDADCHRVGTRSLANRSIIQPPRLKMFFSPSMLIWCGSGRLATTTTEHSKTMSP